MYRSINRKVDPLMSLAESVDTGNLIFGRKYADRQAGTKYLAPSDPYQTTVLVRQTDAANSNGVHRRNIQIQAKYLDVDSVPTGKLATVNISVVYPAMESVTVVPEQCLKVAAALLNSAALDTHSLSTFGAAFLAGDS